MTTLVVLMSVGFAGCLGGNEDRPAPERKQPARTPTASAKPSTPATPLATARSSVGDPDYGGLRFDLMSLDRAGDVVVAQIRLFNEADEDVSIGSNLLGGSWTTTPPGGFSDVSGFALADSASRRLYTVLREPGGECVCTRTDALEHPFLDPGADFTVYAAFPAPPASTTTVTLINPLGPPFARVPIGDGAPPRLPRADPPPDLSTLSADAPVVLPISSLSDALDRSRSVSENDREVDIRLSTDVLFALNSARLSGRARGVLRDAARRIERAKARSVRLEGHADTTGTDAINDPLSRRRAEAVAKALRPLVGGDVRFSARGYGSRRPVASNDEPEGRRRNRRVSVIFSRPPADQGDTAEEDAGSGPVVQGKPASGQTIEVEGRQATAGDTVTVELESLVADGDLATLTYIVRNTGSEQTEVSTLLGSGLDDTYRFARQSISGVSLVDRHARQRYFVAAVPVEDDQICLCSDTAGAHLGMGGLEPGEEGRFYATYAVPEDAQAVTVEFGPDAKLADVAIDRSG